MDTMYNDKSHSYTDTTLDFEKDDSSKWKIQHSLYGKPTDAVRFLRRDSFHPPHIFNLYRILNIYVLFYVTLKKVPEMKV